MSKIIYLAQNSDRIAPQIELPDGGTVFVRGPTDQELVQICELSKSEIGATVAPLDVVQRVYKHNPDSFWAIFYLPKDTEPGEARFSGYYSFLFLNGAGEQALATGQFNALDPDLNQLTKAGDRPVVAYIWALVARRVSTLATPLVAMALGKERYGGVPIYAKAGTLGGLNAIKRYGFVSARPSDFGLGDLFRLDPEISGAVPV